MLNGYVVDEGYEKGQLCEIDIPGYGKREYWISLSHDYTGLSNLTGEPLEYMNKKPSDFQWGVYGEDMQVQKKICNAFLLNFDRFRLTGRGLYIYSKCKGSGKTLLACCLANDLLDKTGMAVKFISVTDYIDRIKNHEDLADYRNASFLVLDDIGAQSEKQDWIREVLFSLIDKRYSQNLSTIFTSNEPIERCSEDGRIVDRVYEMSIPVKMPEVSIRRQKADVYRQKFMQEVCA